MTCLKVFLWASLAVGLAVGNYSHDLATRLVNYAGASYCKGAVIDNWNCAACKKVPGFTNIVQHHGSITDAHAISGFDPTLGARVVAFMGTNADLKTWIDDVLIAPTTCYEQIGCKSCTCHPGFKNAYGSIADSVHDAVVSMPPGKLIITGHSLGAAQATHCAIDFAKNRGLKADHVYTVGQPRVGNDVFAHYYDQLGLDHWRVTHHEDPIPHLPWRGLGGYKQVLREAYYVDANQPAPTKLCDPTYAEDPTCTDQFNDELTLPHITDHWNYLGFSFAKDVLVCTVTEDGASSTAIVV